jgi:glycerol-3-phosphate cytidylyltransferase
MKNDNPKFDRLIFGFYYKGTMYVKVFSGAGEDASKSDSGSLSVSVFISPNKESNYTKKENNAFYNKETKKVNYDPIIRNGKDLLVYVKSILDEDDRDKDYKYTPVPNKPDTKNKPVQSIVERQLTLGACRYVDEIVVYSTEQDLIDLILTLPVDVRILGVEYEDTNFTGRNEGAGRGIQHVFNKRDHSFSSSSLRKRVAESERTKI